MSSSSCHAANASGEASAQPPSTLATQPDVNAAVGDKVLRSTDLFGSDVVVTIEHQGAHYQLRATRQGKLILTK